MNGRISKALRKMVYGDLVPRYVKTSKSILKKKIHYVNIQDPKTGKDLIVNKYIETRDDYRRVFKALKKRYKPFKGATRKIRTRRGEGTRSLT